MSDGSRKRPRRSCRRDADESNHHQLTSLRTLRLAIGALHRGHTLVITGAGISAAAGLPTFSGKRGVYSRASQKLGLQHGQDLFRYKYWRRHPRECFAFMAQLQRAASKAVPTTTHKTLVELEGHNKLVRHYTLNVDGLASKAGMTLWNGPQSPEGATVELHGTLHELLCPQCHGRRKVPVSVRNTGSAIPCASCGADLRFRVLLYDEEDAHVVPDSTVGLMRRDLLAARAILWVGVSFEQSATCELFRTMWTIAEEQNHSLPWFIVNPNAREAVECLRTSVPEFDDQQVHELSVTSDEFFKCYRDGLTGSETPFVS